MLLHFARMLKEEGSTISTAVCIILIVLIPLCYSFGYCLQSHSLSLKSTDHVFGCFSRNIALFLGVITALLANFLYIIVLYHAPVYVLAVTFSLTLVSVAGCSVYFLGDALPSRLYFFGHAILIAEAIVFAVILRKPIYQFPGNRLTDINTASAIYWAILLSIVLVGGIFVIWFEGKNMPTKINRRSQRLSPAGARSQILAKTISEDFEQPTDPPDHNRTYDDLARDSFFQEQPAAVKPATLLIAQNLYPTFLGIIEAGFAFPFNQYQNLALNIMWDIVLTFGIITFLVLVYSRFENTAVFPVELSVLTFVTILSGLLLSDEDAMKDSLSWVYTGIFGFILLGGIVTITSAYWRKNLDDSENLRRGVSLSDIIIPDGSFDSEERDGIKSSSDPMASMHSSDKKDGPSKTSFFSNPLGVISDPIRGIFS